MRNGTDFIERRKHKRLKAKERAFAVLKSNSAKLGQIINISKGGLTFRYIPNGKKSNGSFEVDIFIAGNDFHLKKVPTRIVLDCDISNKVSFSSLPMRQLSMQFGEMMPEQKSKLAFFLENHTLSGS